MIVNEEINRIDETGVVRPLLFIFATTYNIKKEGGLDVDL